jgi:hypothetical protein
VHRLARLEDPALPVTPTAAVGPMSVGPVAQAGDAVTMTVAATPRPPPASTPARADEAGPLRAMTDDLAAQLRAEAEGAARESRPPSFAAVAARVLEVPPGQVTHPDDAARLIHLLSVTATGGPAAGAAESLESRAWTWASDIAAAHPAAPSVASLLAHLGLVLREQEGSMLAGAIDPANLQALHRRAMDTAPDRPGVFMRAAMFHLSSSGDGAEAERCLARAFRLDRTNEWIARRLADIYARTGRGGDGLHVLDLCAREGGAAASAELLWQAAVRASGLGKHEATLTYLDVFERRVGESTPLWTNYHRATSLLALNRPAEALPAIEREATAYAAASEGRAESGLHIHAVRAAAAAALQQPDAVRQHVLAAAGVNLTSIQDLSRAGILASHAYLWDAATSTLPDSDDPARRHLTQRLLASGVIPGAFWRHHRLGNRGAGAATDKVKGLHHYLVNIRQPFDARFTESGACPPDLREARAYQVQYGVLATDEADAEQRALAWQSRAADLAPEVISIQPDGGPYFDHPGITDRSVPEPVDDALSA